MLYLFEKEFEFAVSVKQSAMNHALRSGLSVVQSKQLADQSFDLSRRQYAIDFLKKLDFPIRDLKNIDLKKIFDALLASGSFDYSFEELESWVKKINNESLRRVYVYFYSKSESPLKSRKKLSFLKIPKLQSYSLNDLSELKKLMISVSRNLDRLEFCDNNSSNSRAYMHKQDLFKVLEDILRSDVAQKRADDKYCNLNSVQIDWLSVLKSKLNAQNVEQNSKYYDHIIVGFVLASDVADYVNNWNRDVNEELKANAESDIVK